MKYPYLLRNITISLFTLISLSACKSTSDIQSSDWLTVKTEHFEFYSNQSETVTRNIVENLTVFDRLIRQESQQQANGVSTYVIILSQDELRALERRNLAGLFTSKVGHNLMLVDGEQKIESVQTMLHEYMHYLSNYKPYEQPLWLEEGAAEYYSGVESTKEHLKVGVIQQGRLDWLLYEKWIPAEKLIAAESYSEFNDRQLTMFYAQSWLLTFYLNSPEYNKDSRYNLSYRKYITNVTNKVPPFEAFEDAFGIKVSEINSTLQRFMRKKSKFIIRMLEKAPYLKGVDLKLVPAEEDEINLIMAQVASDLGEPNLANTLLAKTASTTANTAIANAQLALLAAQSSNNDHKDQQIAFSLHQAADNPNVQLTIAKTYTELAGNSDNAERRSQLIEKARYHYLQAWKLNKTDPELYYHYGTTFLLQLDDIAEGVAMLEEANHLNPASNQIQKKLFAAYALHNTEKAKIFGEHLSRKFAHYSDTGEWINNTIRISEHYLNYLSVSSPYKSWAITADGAYGYAYNSDSSDSAKRNAIELCEQYTGENQQCQLIHSDQEDLAPLNRFIIRQVLE